ncbi:aminotransferase class V-fold PLP-dependent enzyme [Aeoliella sp. SH292]|uniref:aminotransferase class V-fold PLP-dependent enzyme n=1 Tax=Aeoliella sp. SH292 TaxID=3454464 RepID=UPI003F955488
MPTLPTPPPAARHWRLDPRVTYLNHGSYGACPTAVLDAQAKWRDQMEADAVSFFARGLFDMLDRSRRALAAEFGGEAGDYVFCRNATTAVETILENVARGHGLADGRPLGPGDELLAFDHEYRACLNNLNRLAARTGARVVHVPMPLEREELWPIGVDEIVESLLAAVTPRTRICLLSHITSASGAVLPVARIVRELEHRGVTTVVDAAHGPGAVMVDIAALGCAFYTSNCHKWLCSPKGAALLWVRPDLQDGFRPLVLSNHAEANAFPLGAGERSKYQMEFDYTGTDDYTAAGAVADALEILPQIADTDWRGIIARNHQLVLEGRDLLCQRLGVEPPYADELIGPMATLPLPIVEESRRQSLAARPTYFADALQDALLTNHGIQVPVWRNKSDLADGRRYFRISAQLYNSVEQYEYLAGGLVEELERE